MSEQKDFYVGYLSMPKRLSLFNRVMAVGLIAAGMVLALVLGLRAPDVGEGNWDIYNYVEMTGTLKLEPYPMLIIKGYDRPVLVTSDGKRSAKPFLEGLDGQTVTLYGNIASRGNWRMLTIAGKGDILSAKQNSEPLAISVRPGEVVRLVGEIVDSKCMLGAMRPGEGYVHRACASLCLMGGMPPMALLRKPDGRKAAYLLVGYDGNSVSEALAPHVAVPIQMEGQLEYWGDMPVVQMDPNSVKRLKGQALADFGPSIGTASGPAFCRLS